MMDKEVFYKIASGQVEDPRLDLEVNGEHQVFEGRDAMVFAFGALFGLKMASPETETTVENIT